MTNIKNIKNAKKRLYVFPHCTLSPLAKGVQSIHSTVELFNKYILHALYKDEDNDYYINSADAINATDAFEILLDWSLNHKTVIMLNPETTFGLNKIKKLLEKQENFYPWASFKEDEKDDLISISIVIPEKIYKMAGCNRLICIESSNASNASNVSNASKSDIVYTENLETIKLNKNYKRFNEFEIRLIQLIQYNINQYNINKTTNNN